MSEENEPDIYRAIKRDAMLENVHIDPKVKALFKYIPLLSVFSSLLLIFSFLPHTYITD